MEKKFTPYNEMVAPCDEFSKRGFGAMDTKFTPGPWAIVLAGDDKGGRWHIDSDDGPLICSTAREGDAKLIAAAPELYEVVRQFVEGEEDDHAVMNRAQAALKKARGD